jgi:uracil-DNA glycosylase family 4
MKGFFYTVEEKKRKKSVGKKSTAKKSTKNVTKKLTCEDCELYQNCTSPKMRPTGKGKEKILIVAEAPGATEDRKGSQLVGESGQLLREELKKIGYDLDRDCWKTNAVICRPPKNRKPTTKEINCCRNNLMKFIRVNKPEKIIVLGAIALQSLINETGIEKWVGVCIPDQRLGCCVYPTYHPAYVLRNQQDVVLKKEFAHHLFLAFEVNKPFPISEMKKDISILNSPFEANLFIQNIPDNSTISIDIETTGLKPHKEGHEIICIAIAVMDKCSVFPIFHGNTKEDKLFLKTLKKLLENKTIKKVAHNLKFENSWLYHVLGIKIKNWYWDTMIGVHIMDNRTGVTGLKHQLYIRYGIKGYDDEVSAYLKSSGKSSYEFNNIKECDQNKLMLYCGMDALGTLWLQRDQEKEMSQSDKKAYTFFHKGTLALAWVEKNGIKINEAFYNKKIKLLTKKMEQLDEKIMNSKEVKKWDGKQVFKHTSNKDLPRLLFDILKIKSNQKTEKGNCSVSQSALEEIKIPLVQNILKWRKLKKLRDTYLAGYVRETVNGKMYPVFNLNTVTTFRSSSSSPNFQNVPKHDKKALKLTRSGITTRKGNQLMEVDYSGMEVTISACYHQDPAMIKYLKDETKDMHRDQAMNLFIMSEEEVKEMETRYLAKNNFVFPQFYGSWWKECAENLWSKSDKKIIEHLKKKGIKKLGKLIKRDQKIIGCTDFYDHVKKVEYDFWNKKFRVYNKWKKETWEQYQQDGYIRTLTGFTLNKRMQKNDALNYPIQGSAFHCLLWSLCKIYMYLKKNKYKTKIIGQIHDSILFDIVPSEKEKLKPVIRKIMTEDIRKKFKWIIVPLEIDAEISEVDGNWGEMKKEEI